MDLKKACGFAMFYDTQSRMVQIFRGKCVAIEDGRLTLRSYPLVHHFDFSGLQVHGNLQVGCFLELDFKDKTLKVLSPSPLKTSTTWSDHVFNPRRIKGTAVREQVELQIREFFLERDFREVRTPILVTCPGMEPHIRPFQVGASGYLHTSPEFAMKRLLAGGIEKIFQIVPCFRNEPRSSTHHPEFTMLEWYRSFEKYESIMKDTEDLIESLALRVLGHSTIRYQGKNLNVKTPWERLSIYDLFESIAKVDLRKCSESPMLSEECRRLGLAVGKNDSWDDLYFKIWMDCIEPEISKERAVIVHGYPASQSALAEVEVDSKGTSIARRFEFYCGGLELGNSFQELTDAAEQRRRFEKDMNLRQNIYGPSFEMTPIDEGFLLALEEGLPPSSGIAVGVDRLIMLLADEPDIQFTRSV